MVTPDQKKKLLKAKIAVALQDELGRVPKEEEVNAARRRTRINQRYGSLICASDLIANPCGLRWTGSRGIERATGGLRGCADSFGAAGFTENSRLCSIQRGRDLRTARAPTKVSRTSFRLPSGRTQTVY